MKLEELRKIAEARTRGEWLNTKPNHPDSNFRLQIGDCVWPMNDNNADFIAMAANNFDQILDELEAARERLGPAGYKLLQRYVKMQDVVEAAKAFLPELETGEGYICTHTENKLRESLEVLEKE